MPERLCPNCGTPAPQSFCPECGQKQLDRRITLRHVLSDFLEDQFGLNARAGRTIRALLLHPGLLSEEYFAGRIERYIPPFKLYLIISVLFFLLINVVTMRRMGDDLIQQIRASQDSVRVMKQRGVRISERRPGLTITGLDTTNWLRDVRVNTGLGALDRMAGKQLRKLSELGVDAGTRRFVGALLTQAPRVLFVLLPVYALLLFAFHFRRRRYYVEHFVFALHVHAFIFLLLVPTLLLNIAWLHTLCFVVILLYAFIAMKRFYHQSYLVALIKGFFLWVLYWVLFAVGLVGATLLALATV